MKQSKVLTTKKRIVIKQGGSSLADPSTLNELSLIIGGYQQRGFEVVLVHGGGPAINAELVKRGITWKFIDGQRQTTPEMMTVIDQVLGQKVNSELVNGLQMGGIRSIGLSGADDQILICRQLNFELGQVGSVEAVNTVAMETALSEGLLPVVAPIGRGENGMKFNVNADWAATKIAIALKADKLIFLTDQDGILGEKKRLIRRATPLLIQQLISEGIISGGMCTKANAMMSALQYGVTQVRVLNANQSSQIFSKATVGTILRYEKETMIKEVMHVYAS